MYNIPVTTLRYQAIESFLQACWQAKLAAWRARWAGEWRALLRFEDVKGRLNQGKKYLGVHTLRVKQLTGSVGRAGDFDAQFRPLKRHLRERWIAQLMALEASGWQPIQVYKVGDDYFVEDGHHRMSVARFTGMEFIDAEVWEYAVPPAIGGQVSGRLVDRSCVVAAPRSLHPRET